MARQPKVNLDAIIQPENVKDFQAPEPDPEPKVETSETKTRNYPSREGKVPVQFHLNKDAHRQLKIVCAETDRSQQDICIEALNAWFQMNDKPPIA